MAASEDNTGHTLITVRGLQELLYVSKDWIYHRVRRNAADPLPVHRLGRALRFDPQEIQEYLACRSGPLDAKVSSVSRSRERRKRMLSRRHFQTGGRPRLEGRKTKFWRGWSWQYFSDGTRRRKSVFIGYKSEYPTERAARRRLNDIVSKMNDPECEPSSTLTLGELYEEHVELAFPMLKKSTQDDMRLSLNKHVLPVLGLMSIGKLDRDLLQRHINRLWTQGVSWATLNKIKVYLGSLFSRAVDDGRLTKNTAHQIKLPPRPAPKRPKLMEEAHVLAIERTIQDGKIRTLWWLTYQTGLRIGEASALRWSSIDWEKGKITVRESVRWFALSPPKTPNSVRLVYLIEEQLERLKEYRRLFPDATEDDFVFPNAHGTGPVGYANVMRRAIKPVAKALGITTVGWHALRHVNSTIMDEKHVPMGVRKDRLGHAAERTTLIYTHGRVEEHRRASRTVYEHYEKIAKASQAQMLTPPCDSPDLGTTLGTASPRP
jgi:integrase